MLEKYSFDYLLKVFSQLEWKGQEYRDHSRIVKGIKNLVKDNDIKIIYPKNMFLDSEDFIIYTFTDEYVYITRLHEDNQDYVSNTIIKLEDIKRVKILTKIQDSELEPKGVELHFYDDKIISLNSELDTNEHHKYNFRRLIDELIEFLI